MNKQYSSFEEIDLQLNILKIQRKIAVESLKLNVNRSKENLQPSHLISGFSGNFQKVFLAFALKKMISIFRRKKQS
jgi:hypothetical protein